MSEGQTPDQHDDFASEPDAGGKRAAEGAEQAQDEHHGHVAAGLDVSAAASTHALPRASEPIDRTPLRKRFGAEGRDR